MGNFRVPIDPFTLTYQDIFLFKPLYRTTHQWLMEANFTDETGKGENWEEFYIHKENGPVYEINFRWKTRKGSKTKGVYYIMFVEFLLIAGSVEERIIDGRKVKGETGEVTIRINSFIEVENADWDESSFLAQVKHRTFRRHHREIMHQLKAYYYGQAKGLFEMLKQYLETKAAFKGQEDMLHQKFDQI